jgi:hypothetical protein
MRILIEGDCNDGDYISEMSEITQETLDLILPVIEAVKAYTEYHNWSNEYDNKSLEDKYPQLCVRNEDYDPEDEDDYEFVCGWALKMFSSLVPSSEYGVHSINKIEVYHCDPVKLL